MRKSFLELFEEAKKQGFYTNIELSDYIKDKRCTRCNRKSHDCKICCFPGNFQIINRCGTCMSDHLHILNEKDIFLLKVHGLL